MAKFDVGDKVQMTGVPFVVEVLEIEACGDNVGADICGQEVFRFKDPESGEDDWMHTSEFERV